MSNLIKQMENNMSLEIDSVGLNDKVSCKKYGIGTVIKCTEQPSITVQFNNTKRITFDQKLADAVKLNLLSEAGWA